MQNPTNCEDLTSQGELGLQNDSSCAESSDCYGELPVIYFVGKANVHPNIGPIDGSLVRNNTQNSRTWISDKENDFANNHLSERILILTWPYQLRSFAAELRT